MWRKFMVDGEVFLTRGDPTRFLVKKAKEKNKHRKGDYYIDGNKLVFYKHTTLSRYKCLGVYKDRACSKEIRIT